MAEKVSKIFLIAVIGILAVSCSSTRQVAYFQDSAEGSSVQLPTKNTITVDVSDKLSIVVNSKDPTLAALFNLPIISYQTGIINTGFANSGNQISTYTVDNEGNIDFPVLGKVHVQGLKRDEIAAKIKNLIETNNYIKDPVVIVEFANLFVSVMGDVSHPGRYSLDKDKMTVVDAIAKASDMNITASRTDVKVFREQDGKQVCYTLNFTSAADVFASPAYYLQPDDIIYVNPNKMRARQSTVNGNNLLSTSFWISVGSLLTTVINLVIVASRR